MDAVKGDQQGAINVEKIGIRVHPLEAVRFDRLGLKSEFAHDCALQFLKPKARSLVLLRHHQARDLSCLAGSLITIHHDRTQADISRGRLESRRHIAKKFAYDQFLLHPDDTVVWPGHADIGDVRSAARQHALIGRGNMGVGADDNRDSFIEIPAQRNFF